MQGLSKHDLSEQGPGEAALERLSLAPGLALILDLDGVVIDSMRVHELAWRRYLESLGIEPGDIAGRMHGRRNDEIVRDFLGPEADPRDVFAHGAAKERLFRHLMSKHLSEHLVPGIAPWLARAGRAPVALATNAERANIDFVLDGANLRAYFHVIVDGSQVPSPKPAPDVYLKAAEELGIATGNCIVFEDSPVGVAAARAAGMRVVGVLTHASPLDGIALGVPDFTDPSLDRWLAAQRAE